MRYVGFAAVVSALVVGTAVAVAVIPIEGQSQERERPEEHQGLVLSSLDLLDVRGSEIGVTVRDVDEADVKREKLASESGAVIDEVAGDGPAAKAGFKAGDVVVEFDGERVRSARQLTRLVRETPAGRQVRAMVTRDGRRVELQVTPDAAPGMRLSRDLRSLGRGFRFDMPELPQHFDFELLTRPGRLGVQTSELTPQLAEYFGTRDGVLVTRVDPETPAARAGLKAGDVITAVGGRQIDSAAELRRELNRTESGEEVELTVMRDRKELRLKATIESTSRRLRRLPARRTI